MSRKLAKILYFVIFSVGMVLMLVFSSLKKFTLAYVAGGFIIAGILFCSYHMRCPQCGAWPVRGTFFAKYCRRCGEKLDD
jgi:hypothetical protein